MSYPGARPKKEPGPQSPSEWIGGVVGVIVIIGLIMWWLHSVDKAGKNNDSPGNCMANQAAYERCETWLHKP